MYTKITRYKSLGVRYTYIKKDGKIKRNILQIGFLIFTLWIDSNKDFGDFSRCQKKELAFIIETKVCGLPTGLKFNTRYLLTITTPLAEVCPFGGYYVGRIFHVNEFEWGHFEITLFKIKHEIRQLPYDQYRDQEFTNN